MRILSWNINGVRTLPQYHPWFSMKTFEAILDELKADIICFQEMKIQKSLLERTVALPGHFDSVFSFPLSNRGYSGVAVYTDSRNIVPLKAEEGLTGNLQPRTPLAEDEKVSRSYPDPVDFDFFPEEDGTTPFDFTALDNEGRAVILDFGLFVLINTYCPALASEGRLPFKMNYHRLLEERVRLLIEVEKREVIVLGDINISAQPIDHGEGKLGSNLREFWDSPHRAWYKNWLAPSGPMVDVIRQSWPDREGMYTCWNTVISGRDANYGSRIDYILLTKGLLPWFKFGDIQADIRGSDHCLVYIDLHDEIIDPSGKPITLKEAMGMKVNSGGTIGKREPPRIAAKFWDEFSGKQTLLSTFFAKKGSTPPAPVPLVGMKTKETNGVEDSCTEAIAPLLSSSEQPLTQLDAPPNSLKSLGKRKSISGTTITERGQTSSKKQKNQKPGQMKLMSFFGAPPVPVSNTKKNKSKSSISTQKSLSCSPLDDSKTLIFAEAIDVDPDPDSSQEPSQTSTLLTEEEQLEADEAYARSLAEADGQIPELRSSQSTSSTNEGSKTAWAGLLTPLQPPLCVIHSEPAKKFVVNKSGPNKGKVFFVCSRPVGPGYDKGRGERLREEVDHKYRCNFFKWASDVRKSTIQ